MQKKNLAGIKFFIFFALSTGVLTGCLKTEGTLKIRGKVLDEFTKEQITGKDIIVQGLIKKNNKFFPIYVGEFFTDSSGCFSYSLVKVRDARYYNFSLVGDSDYSFRTKILGLMELQQNSKYLFFYVNKLVDLTIKINRKSKTPLWDTLTLAWESDGISDRFLFPYLINNYGKIKTSFGFTEGTELRWIGGKVNTTINTKVFADKKTKLLWGLKRNGQIKDLTDTITCRRDFQNIVYFTY